MNTKATLGFAGIFSILFFTMITFDTNTAEPAPSFMAQVPYIAVLYVWGAWFERDRARRRIQYPLDTGMLIYALWPIAIPFYILNTRGKKGIRTLFVILLYLVVFLVIGTIFGSALNTLLVNP